MRAAIAAQQRGVRTEMKPRKVSTDSDPGPSLQRLNDYLERNFPDFFAEARFQVGDDDYFLYARFGQYLARIPPDTTLTLHIVRRTQLRAITLTAREPPG